MILEDRPPARELEIRLGATHIKWEWHPETQAVFLEISEKTAEHGIRQGQLIQIEAGEMLENSGLGPEGSDDEIKQAMETYGRFLAIQSKTVFQTARVHGELETGKLLGSVGLVHAAIILGVDPVELEQELATMVEKIVQKSMDGLEEPLKMAARGILGLCQVVKGTEDKGDLADIEKVLEAKKIIGVKRRKKDGGGWDSFLSGM